MHFVLKAGLVTASVLGLGAAIHLHAHAADAPAPVAQNLGGVAVPADLELHIRAMVRAHAAAGQADAAEAHAMALIKAHLAEVAKDPVLTAQANQVMAAAAAGDEDALEHVHQMLMAIIGGGDLHH